MHSRLHLTIVVGAISKHKFNIITLISYLIIYDLVHLMSDDKTQEQIVQISSNKTNSIYLSI